MSTKTQNDEISNKLSINVGFIGGGNMSTAIIKGMLKYGKYPPSNIWVSGPHLENLQVHKQLGANVTVKNGEVLSNCDVVFLGVKPGALSNAIQGCLDTLPDNVLSKNLLFVSMLAGINIEQLRQAVDLLPLQVNVVRIMPNTPMAVGAGVCLYSPDNTVTDQQCTLLEKILQPCGVVERIPEGLMGPLGALTGCGPAFLYVAIEALADGAVKQGAPRDKANKLAAQVVLGSGQMVLNSGKHPAVLKDEVCSPGGSTICGITALENGKLRASLINAIEAAANRTREMGKK
ncbi:pyrroline-5-carboxylate reductase 3 [Epargyreus clarus]|uniref:pyrroline-5-carboxylate reductase 3 n=1 Tax=Epargyreus clarus TaxID=520877 RepID=UPI003C301FCF